MTLNQTRTATVPTRSARINAVTVNTRRGDRRSVTAPPISIRAVRGIVAVIRMVPRARLDPVNWRTSHGIATRLNWVPSTEMDEPSHRFRKCGRKNGWRYSCGAGGAIAGAGPEVADAVLMGEVPPQAFYTLSPAMDSALRRSESSVVDRLVELDLVPGDGLREVGFRRVRRLLERELHTADVPVVAVEHLDVVVLVYLGEVLGAHHTAREEGLRVEVVVAFRAIGRGHLELVDRRAVQRLFADHLDLVPFRPGIDERPLRIGETVVAGRALGGHRRRLHD